MNRDPITDESRLTDAEWLAKSHAGAVSVLAELTINPECDQSKLRTGRKTHHCHGMHNGERRIKCDDPIVAGAQYLEYFGESAPYESGQRYHIYCALSQGLLVAAAPEPLLCESCGESGPTVKERVRYHATCEICQARIEYDWFSGAADRGF